MMKFNCLIICVMLTSLVRAGNVTVSGIAPGEEGQVIRLMTFSDQLSYEKVPLCTVQVDEDGKFSLVADIDQVTYAFLEINFQQGSVFLQPGQHYEVMIESDPGAISKTYYDQKPLGIVFVADDEDNINTRIGFFNELYNDFILANSASIHSQDKKVLMQKFRSQVIDLIGRINNEYMADYIRYKTAIVEQFLMVKSKKTLAAEYLTEEPILYNNVEYMDFFSLYFEKYLVSNNRYFSYNMTFDLVNGDAALAEILDTLGRDPVLEREDLRELVLMASLKEMASMQGFKRERIRSFYAELAANSLYEGNRLIAENLFNRMNWLRQGLPAPALSLPAGDGREISLSDYKGRFVYLSFIIPGHIVSDAEMEMLLDTWEELHERMDFLVVTVGRAGSMAPGPGQAAKPWQEVPFNNDFDLLDRFGAASLPIFILIGPDGNIYRYPAPNPSENLKAYLDGII